MLIKTCIKDEPVPEGDLVESFFKNSKLMCEHEMKGNGSYPLYMDEVNAFYHAFRQSDSDRMLDSLQKIKQLKKTCHKNFK